MPASRSRLLLASLGIAGIAGAFAFADARTGEGADDWKVHDMDRPQPAMVTPGVAGTATTPGTAPSDAIVLLGKGSGLDAWKNGKWKVGNDGVMKVVPGSGDNHTRQSFGDCQFHIEWKVPADRECDGQKGCNSGIFFLDRYEVQIVGSNPNQTFPDGQAGSLFGQYPPMVNPCRPNGEWNTFDIVFTAPRFDGDGKLVSPANTTLLFNGVLVLDHAENMGITVFGSRAKYSPHDPTGPIRIQDHGDPLEFANIWVRPLPARARAW